MADTDSSSDDNKHNINSELLSPSALFQARSRSHKIPVKGQKDFLPTGSEQQTTHLQQSLDEHWNLLAEERVERLGNLVKAVWIPEERLVELQSPAGKFWHTMGFSDRGKQFLLPEEALYLLECGNVQIMYRDLPLSIQEGYERFLCDDSLSLHQYQVFAHLKRLGYVVNRFDPSSVPSRYERLLNLPASADRQKRQLKRKRSQSPVSSEETESGGKSDEQALPSSASAPCESSTGTWWTEGEVQPHSAQPSNSAPHWDFSTISFPDLGAGGRSSDHLPSPDPDLLPAGLKVGPCDMSVWLNRLNVRTERPSGRHRERHHRDVNRDREVRDCRNWTEYLQLLERRRRFRKETVRPEHLWGREVKPLSQPGHSSSHRELLDQISIIRPQELTDPSIRTSPSGQWKISFDIYLPDVVAEFKKSQPGKPHSRMCVCRFDGPVPDLRVMKQLATQSGDVPVTFAVVDHGDISFYCFKQFKLPTDVY